METILKEVIDDFENCYGNCKECKCNRFLAEIIDTTGNTYLCGILETIKRDFEKYGTEK